jgi:lipid-binding SYLF domain-containing protein
MRASTLSARIAILVLSTLLAATSAVAAERQELHLTTATRVLNELMQMPEQNIPTWLLERAHAVAVIPGVIKVGLVAGGRRGKGILVVRKNDGAWSNPVFINLTGGSIGFQAGVQSTDVVLVFTSRQSIEGIVGGKVTLGADASVAAGPVGRQSSAATDIGLTAQVYSYSRASGLFAGVALDGSALTIDHKSNEAFYGRPAVLASEIIADTAPSAPAPAQDFIGAIQRAATGTTATRTVERTSPSPSASAPASSQGRPAEPGALTTYPMEDPKPGEEPPE